MKKMHQTDTGVSALNLYQQAIEVHGFVFFSGILPLVKETNEFPSQLFDEQVKQTFMNIDQLLEATHLVKKDIIKITVLLDDIKNMDRLNELYCTYFGNEVPVRTCFAVKQLPRRAQIEIEVIAARSI